MDPVGGVPGDIPQQEPVKMVQESVITQDDQSGYGIPCQVLDSFPNCQKKVKVWMPEATTQYTKGTDGALRMRIPAVHRESRQLVWLEAPTTDWAEAAVFRDCPDFEPYRPVVPDCGWTSMVKQGSTHTLTGAVLCEADD